MVNSDIVIDNAAAILITRLARSQQRRWQGGSGTTPLLASMPWREVMADDRKEGERAATATAAVALMTPRAEQQVCGPVGCNCA